MKNSKWTTLLLGVCSLAIATALLGGTPASAQETNAPMTKAEKKKADREDKPVLHAKRVKVLAYDSTVRKPITHPDIFDISRNTSQTNQVPKANKVIARLSCEGRVNEESEMITAIIYRAGKLGAEGVVILPPERNGNIWSVFASRKVFLANAIVYTGVKSE